MLIIPPAKIPRWKAYLYTLAQRYRLYKWLNAGWLKLNLNKEEIVLLRNMFNKYLPKEVHRKVRTVRYERLIKEVLIKQVTIAGRQEIELAMKLTWVKHIKSEELNMELKAIREFGKEVGLSLLEMTKMNEDELIIAILKNTKQNQKYSQDYIAWYESIPDKYFDAMHPDVNATNDDNDGANAEPSNNGDLLEALGTTLEEINEAINGLTKIDELRGLVQDADFGILFQNVDITKHKTVKALKNAMLTAVQPADSSDNDNANSSDDDLGIDETTIVEWATIISEIESEEELFEFVSDSDVSAVFSDRLNIDDDDINVESIKAQMMAILGINEDEPEPEPKPMSLKDRMAAKKAEAAKKSETSNKDKDDDYVVPFDPNSFDLDEVFANAEGLGIPKLRKFAKQIGVVAGPGSNKATLLSMIANRLTEMAEGGVEVSESTNTEEITVTKSTVQDAIDAEDKDSLIAFCETFEIPLSGLMKKSVKLMGAKLMEVVPDDTPVNRNTTNASTGRLSLANKMKKTDKNAPPSETKSIYQLIEEMVLSGESEADILKAVKPLYTEKGKSLLYIKKRVSQMVEIITKDNE